MDFGWINSNNSWNWTCRQAMWNTCNHHHHNIVQQGKKMCLSSLNLSVTKMIIRMSSRHAYPLTSWHATTCVCFLYRNRSDLALVIQIFCGFSPLPIPPVYFQYHSICDLVMVSLILHVIRLHLSTVVAADKILADFGLGNLFPSNNISRI